MVELEFKLKLSQAVAVALISLVTGTSVKFLQSKRRKRK